MAGGLSIPPNQTPYGIAVGFRVYPTAHFNYHNRALTPAKLGRKVRNSL